MFWNIFRILIFLKKNTNENLTFWGFEGHVSIECDTLQLFYSENYMHTLLYSWINLVVKWNLFVMFQFRLSWEIGQSRGRGFVPGLAVLLHARGLVRLSTVSAMCWLSSQNFAACRGIALHGSPPRSPPASPAGCGNCTACCPSSPLNPGWKVYRWRVYTKIEQHATLPGYDTLPRWSLRNHPSGSPQATPCRSCAKYWHSDKLWKRNERPRLTRN